MKLDFSLAALEGRSRFLNVFFLPLKRGLCKVMCTCVQAGGMRSDSPLRRRRSAFTDFLFSTGSQEAKQKTGGFFNVSYVAIKKSKLQSRFEEYVEKLSLTL